MIINRKSLYIRLKHSNVSGSKPTVRDLQPGEVALNTYSGKLFFKKTVNFTQSIVTIAGIDTEGGAANYIPIWNTTSSLSSSIIYQNGNNIAVSGSFTVISGSIIDFQVTNNGTRIGNIINDIHTITGSVNLTGSLSVNGSITGTDGIINDLTASNASNAITASYALTSNISSTGAIVLTSQGTSTTTYTDLTTVGPSVTVVVGPSGNAIVSLTGVLSTNNVAIQSAYMSFSASGVLPSDSSSIFIPSGSNATTRYIQSATFWVTGLTPGTNTFTAKYKSTGGITSTFANRQIIVIPV
jgi:hypothetical protein